MDTTPDTESTEPRNEPGSPPPALEELAATDPADAPDLAERLAAELARRLEDTGAPGESTQPAAPFTPDPEETP
jgi:hypothetical protein